MTLILSLSEDRGSLRRGAEGGGGGYMKLQLGKAKRDQSGLAAYRKHFCHCYCLF